jgi:hypothetical protein
MLLGIGPESCLPADEVSFLAFRVAVKDTLAQLAEQLDHESGQQDDKVGYLGEVELLQPLTTTAQLKLLADVWDGHRSPVVHQASFLEAAVVYAACKTAADLIRDDPDMAQAHLAGSPRRVWAPIAERTAERVEEAFKDVFWQEVDMLRGDMAWPQTPQEEAQAEADLRLPAGCFAPLFAAIAALIGDQPEAPRVERLVGLLTVEEACHAAALLEVEVPDWLLRA